MTTTGEAELILDMGRHFIFEALLSEDQENDSTVFMQRPSGARAPRTTLHMFHLRNAYSPMQPTQNKDIKEVVQTVWHLLQDGPQAVKELHEGTSQPEFADGPVYIVELNAEFRTSEDQVLCLFWIHFVQEAQPVSKHDSWIVLWTPKVATRDQMLEHLRAGQLCQQSAIDCHLLVNHREWLSGRKRVHFGDFVKLTVLAAPGKDASETRRDFFRVERMERNRRVFMSSSESSGPPTDEDADEDQDKSRHTRSRSRGSDEEAQLSL